MIDYYKHLAIADDAPAETIRGAIAGAADPQLRRDALAVLLDPQRRHVYDRNRRLLLTIGELRLHLGLTYTRFWARADFRDFSPGLAPADATAPPKRRVDAMLIAGAFHGSANAFRAVHRHGRRHAARLGGWWIGALFLVVALFALAAWRYFFR